MTMLDANMILRYLLNDSFEMAERAEQYIKTGDVIVSVEVVAEVVYVLKGVYRMECKEIAAAITSFLKLVACRDMDVLCFALDVYGENNLDFVDCVLYGYHMVEGIDIATFDQKLAKLMER